MGKSISQLYQLHKETKWLESLFRKKHFPAVQWFIKTNKQNIDRQSELTLL